jgi:hypothetical protein
MEKVVQPNIISTTERAVAGVSCGHFGTGRLKFKLSTYIQETFGDK